MRKKTNDELVTVKSEVQLPELPAEREGYFKQGYDKLGRPYEKKQDTNGLYSKKEVLKDGTQKLTLKMKPKWVIQTALIKFI